MAPANRQADRVPSDTCGPGLPPGARPQSTGGRGGRLTGGLEVFLQRAPPASYAAIGAPATAQAPFPAYAFIHGQPEEMNVINGYTEEEYLGRIIVGLADLVREVKMHGRTARFDSRAPGVLEEAMQALKLVAENTAAAASAACDTASIIPAALSPEHGAYATH